MMVELMVMVVMRRGGGAIGRVEGLVLSHIATHEEPLLTFEGGLVGGGGGGEGGGVREGGGRGEGRVGGGERGHGGQVG